ncbi:hypothetical protein R1flu_000713 [Riccia fluitans]|uniref:Uncharacterized protein n=1 Tax=Riccia fluitans TaxID=41844 RepID=A0ABD1Y1E8_9MARC
MSHSDRLQLIATFLTGSIIRISAAAGGASQAGEKERERRNPSARGRIHGSSRSPVPTMDQMIFQPMNLQMVDFGK